MNDKPDSVSSKANNDITDEEAGKVFMATGIPKLIVEGHKIGPQHWFDYARAIARYIRSSDETHEVLERENQAASNFIRGCIEALGMGEPPEGFTVNLDALLLQVIGEIESLKGEVLEHTQKAAPASERPAIPELREIVENQAAGRQFLPVSMDLLRRVVSEPSVYHCPCGLTAAACRESACGERKQRHLHALPAAAICGAIVDGKLCQQAPSHEGECSSEKVSTAGDELNGESPRAGASVGQPSSAVGAAQKAAASPGAPPGCGYPECGCPDITQCKAQNGSER